MEDEEWEEEKILLELVGIDKNILATSNYTLVVRFLEFYK